jgi:hypothetical protein
MKFWIDIEDGAGVKQGSGPIATAIGWESTKRLDKAGTFRFSMPANDPKAALAQPKRIARCYAVISEGIDTSYLSELGSGVIDKRSLRISAQGQVMLEISGDDRMRELTYTQVGALAISGTTGPADIIALAPSGWALNLTDGYDETLKSVDYTFEGESVLAALVKLAELTGEHFRLSSGKNVVWMQKDQPDSGIRAIQGADPYAIETNTDVCLITDLEELQDSYDAYVGRVYAYGTGSGMDRVTFSGGTIGAAGWSIGSDSKGDYLQHDATYSAYGIERYQTYKDITEPQMLVEIVYEWMVRQLAPAKSYRLTIAKLDQRTLTVGSTIRVIYQDWKKDVYSGDKVKVVDIDEDLVILETTGRVDQNGMRTVGLVVSTVDKWPEKDSDKIARLVMESQNAYTHQQQGSTTTVDNLHATGDVRADADFNKNGVDGYIFVLDPSFPILNDTTGTAWGGSRNTSTSTTYSFDANGNSNNWPTNAKMVKVYFGGVWGTVGSGSFISAYQRGGSTVLDQKRAAATNGTVGQMDIPTDANGDFDLKTNTAAPSSCTLRLIGYWI